MATNRLNVEYVPAWTPLDERELFLSLDHGQDFHLGSVQNAVFEQAKQSAEKQLKAIFPHDVSDQKVLKRLTNSAITPGEIAFERTVDAIKSLPNWSDHEAKLELISSGFVVSKNKDKKLTKCNGCSKSIREDLAVQSAKIDSTIEEGSWHPACWVATTIRETLQEFRSTKGALDKQVRSAKAILEANKKFMLKGIFASSYSSGQKFISDRKQFDYWIQGLYMEWCKTTKVKEEYRVTYLNYFKEYAEQILEYLAKGTIPAEQTYVRLSKHLDEETADSVIKRMLQVPIKTLRYLGLSYDPEDSVGSVPQYVNELKSNATPQAELDPELAWSEKALCAQVSPEAFFPEKGGSTREAKKLCMACEVRTECLDYAMVHGERFGIWGGLSERERARLARTYEPIKIQYLPTISESESESVSPHIFTIDFQTFADCRVIGEKYRETGAVLLNMVDANEAERNRAVDFLSGMIFAQNGSIQKIAQNVFLLTAGSVQVSGKSSVSAHSDNAYENIRAQLLA